MAYSSRYMRYPSRMIVTRSRSAATRTGVGHAIAVAFPISLMLWAALAHAVGLI